MCVHVCVRAPKISVWLEAILNSWSKESMEMAVVFPITGSVKATT